MNNFDDPWADLANAIVVNAITEYKFAFRRINGKNESMRTYYAWKVATIERFFLSEWCYMLTGVDGEVIIKAVRAGVNRKTPPNNRKSKAGGQSQQVGAKRKDPGVNRKDPGVKRKGSGGKSQRPAPQTQKKGGV